MSKLLYIRQCNYEVDKLIYPAIIVGDSTTKNGRDGAYNAKGESHNIKCGNIRDCVTGKICKWPKIEVIPLTEKYDRDYRIHSLLKEYGSKLVSWDGEVSEGIFETREAFIIKPGHTVSEVVEFIRNEIEGTFKKITFGLRPYQIKPTSQIIKKFDTYNEVLLQAAPRFGKSFVSLRIARNLNKNRILILTPFPDAKFSFKSVSEKHEMMSGYNFIDLNNKDQIKNSKKFVMFLSWQSFAGGNNANLLTKIKPDFIIIDEMHRQSDTEKSKEILRQIDGNSNIKKLFLSATPYNDIMFGDFVNKTKQIVSCDLIYMMNAAAKTDNPFPKLNFYFPENCESVYTELSKKFTFADTDKFTLDKMIGDVQHPEYALAYWKHYFISEINELTGLPIRKTLFTQTKKPSHILVFVPDGAADINFNAFKELTENKDSELYGYDIMQASAEENEISIRKFETDVNKFQEEHKKTIIITKGKGTTGVTLEKLDCVIIAKKMQSTELFVQVACRPITPYINKDNVSVFCLDSEMRLTLAKAANVGVHTSTTVALKRLKEFLAVINVYYHTDNSFITETAEDLLSFVKEIKISTKNEIYKDISDIIIPNFDDEILNALKEIKVDKRSISWSKTIGQGGNSGAKSKNNNKKGNNKKNANEQTNIRNKIIKLFANLDWIIYINDYDTVQKLLKHTFNKNKILNKYIHKIILENISKFDDICYKIHHTSDEILRRSLTSKSETDRIEHPDMITKVFSMMNSLDTCNINTKFVDPCAGRGSYVLEMFNRLMKNKKFINAFPNETIRANYIKEHNIFPNDVDESFVFILKKLGFINTTSYDATTKEYQNMLKKKKIDYIIMNPPYGNLHLKILDAVSKCGAKEIVNLSPIVNYVSRKNAYSDKHIAKFKKQPIKEHCASIEQLSLDDMIKYFNAGAQNAIGIQHYIMNTEYDVTPITFVDGNIPLIRKIMNIVMQDSIDEHKEGKFILNYSRIHGHMEEESKDKYFFMSMTWEKQLETKGNNKIGFTSEKNAHEFYNFWMSKYGIQFIKLWKNDTNIYGKFIPYFWTSPGNEKSAIMKKFNLNENEFNEFMKM